MRVAGITSKDPGQNIIMDYSYTYDNADNITMKQTEHGAYNYTYDELYRLTSATNPNRPAEGFSYDPVGNRLTSAAVSGNWTYNSNNELRGYPAVTVDYDSNGNTVRKTEGATVTDYSWDAENRLMNVECHGEGGAPCHSEHGSGGILYSYDPFGRRLSKTVGDKTIYYFYSDEGLAGEFDASGQVIKTYGFAPNSTWTTDPVFMKQGSNYYFYHNDHLGTPQKMTAVNGAVVWSARYESFGKATIDAGATVENNLRFPGQYYDEETGKHYNWNRYYGPEVGRYGSEDRIGFEEGINFYGYAFSNPLIIIDSEGTATFVTSTYSTGYRACHRPINARGIRDTKARHCFISFNDMGTDTLSYTTKVGSDQDPFNKDTECFDIQGILTVTEKNEKGDCGEDKKYRSEYRSCNKNDIKDNFNKCAEKSFGIYRLLAHNCCDVVRCALAASGCIVPKEIVNINWGF